MNYFLTVTLFLFLSAQAFAQDGKPTSIRVTDGPILGRPASDSMTIWARTDRQGEVNVLYGRKEKQLNLSASFRTRGAQFDYTGTVTIKGLEPNTRYYYRIEDHQLDGSFRTMPSAKNFINPKGNPEGLFNFRFEFACGNNPKGSGDSAGPTLPVFDTLNKQVREKINFAILNGDWLYETRRDYAPQEWLHQVGLNRAETPRVVQKAPTIVGVWQNYKDLLHRGRNLSEWHRHVPTYFTADDHELINDIYGAGETGYVNRRAVFRDIATQAWFDYLGWANPTEHNAPAWFGTAN